MKTKFKFLIERSKDILLNMLSLLIKRALLEETQKVILLYWDGMGGQKWHYNLLNKNNEWNTQLFINRRLLLKDIFTEICYKFLCYKLYAPNFWSSCWKIVWLDAVIFFHFLTYDYLIALTDSNIQLAVSRSRIYFIKEKRQEKSICYWWFCYLCSLFRYF